MLELWGLTPKGRCRSLVLASLALVSIGSIGALLPAFIIYLLSLAVLEGIGSDQTVIRYLFVAFVGIEARLACLAFARATAGTASLALAGELRTRLAAVIAALPLGTIAQSRAGEYESILLGDVDTIVSFLPDAMIELTAALSMVVIAFTVLWVADSRLALVAVLMAVGAWQCVLALRARLPDDSEAERGVRTEMSAVVFQALRTLALERVFPAAPRPHRSTASLTEEYADTRIPRLAATSTLSALGWTLASAFAAVVALAGFAMGGTHADVPILILFTVLLLRCTGAFARLFAAEPVLASVRHAAERISQLLQVDAVTEGTGQLPEDATLRFNGVTFGYPNAGRSAVRDITFTARAGTITAIVGPSGSGKTTLTRLAARFWDPDRGTITLGGVDARTVPLDELMRHVTCVFQDVALLDDTVALNLKLGRPDATEEEVLAAAKAAGAHEFISALPFKYETLVGDRGLRLSRGERQRLQLARALIKNAPIVILDEPTASMDPVTEMEIQDALARIVTGKTVLVVAHRLSTIVDADTIVVIGEDGRLEAEGAHAELLLSSPTYASLWSEYNESMAWSDEEPAALS